jgi:hypothetical protein
MVIVPARRADFSAACVAEVERRSSMKRIMLTGILGMFLIGSAFADTFKYTFSEVAYPDGRVGTIQASVRTTKKGTVTVCDYNTNPNDKFAGEFQGTDNTSTDAAAVQSYCESHFADRTPQN